jgi:hypothetical protein
VKRDPGEGFPGSIVTHQQLIWAGSSEVKRRRGLGAWESSVERSEASQARVREKRSISGECENTLILQAVQEFYHRRVKKT